MALGPPCYAVYLCHKGGKRIAELPWASITWSRVLDDVSAATVTVPISSPRHPKAWAVAAAEAWEHELSIWRGEGSRAGEVWVGPLLEPEWGDDGATLPARDLTQWFERRVLPVDRAYTNVELATIYAQLAADAMAADPSPGLVLATSPTGVKGTRTIVAAAETIAADELRELARDGLDYTTIGRTVIIGGAEVPTPALPDMTERVLRKAKASGLGLLTASDVRVLGSSTQQAGHPIRGQIGGVSQRIGLVQRVFNESSIEDNLSAQRAATTRWDAMHRTPLALTGELDPKRGPSVDRLVPGAVSRANLYAGCKAVNTHVRLARVSASATANQQGTQETVTLEYIPVGTVDQ